MTMRLIATLLALGLVAAACGGSDNEGVASLTGLATTSADDTGAEEVVAEVDREQAMLDFAACMRDNGVDIEDPTVDSEGNLQFGRFGAAAQDAQVARETVEAAMESCRDHLEGIALGRGGGAFDLTELQDTMVEYAACMRDNGYDMPDPDFSGFGPGGDGPGQGGGGPFGLIDFDDPDFVAAQEVCQDLLAGFRGPGGGAIRRGEGNG